MHIYVITIINIRRHSRVMLYQKIGRTNNRTSTMIISLRSMFFFFCDLNETNKKYVE